VGTPGVPLNITKKDLESALRKTRGILSQASKSLGIGRTALYRHIDKFPELRELIDELREDFECEILDDSEGVLKHALSVKETDLGNSLKAAFYILNNKGRSRGYTPPNAQPVPPHQPPTIQIIDYSNA